MSAGNNSRRRNHCTHRRRARVRDYGKARRARQKRSARAAPHVRRYRASWHVRSSKALRRVKGDTEASAGTFASARHLDILFDTIEDIGGGGSEQRCAAGLWETELVGR